MKHTPSNKLAAALAFTCACSLSLYAGAGVVSETKASFSAKAEQSVALTAAFVFPDTIDTMVRTAESSSDQMIGYYNAILATPLDQSLAETQSALKVVEQKKKFITQRSTILTATYKQMEKYYNRAVAEAPEEEGSVSKVIDYVKPGFNKVQDYYNQVQDTIVLSEIDKVIQALEDRIAELEAAALSPEPAPDESNVSAVNETPGETNAHSAQEQN